MNKSDYESILSKVSDRFKSTADQLTDYRTLSGWEWVVYGAVILVLIPFGAVILLSSSLATALYKFDSTITGWVTDWIESREKSTKRFDWLYVQVTLVAALGAILLTALGSIA